MHSTHRESRVHYFPLLYVVLCAPPFLPSDDSCSSPSVARWSRKQHERNRPSFSVLVRRQQLLMFAVCVWRDWPFFFLPTCEIIAPFNHTTLVVALPLFGGNKRRERKNSLHCISSFFHCLFNSLKCRFSTEWHASSPRNDPRQPATETAALKFLRGKVVKTRGIHGTTNRHSM